MNMDERKFRPEPDTRPIMSRVIESPGAIMAKARAVELVNRAHLGLDEALEVVSELEQEVSAMRIPSRFSRTKKPSESPYMPNGLYPSLEGLTEDTYKRQQLLIHLGSLRNDLTHSRYNSILPEILYRLEFIVMDIEATKTEDSPEQEEQNKTYHLQGEEIKLENISLVFSPSAHGLFLGENIHVNPGETVIDVGTGSGLFAILAARKGGKVTATEITREAVEMAKFNGEINNVAIDAREGSFFASFKEKFDVVIANLPQKLILEKKREETQGNAEVFGMHGGASGNEILLSFLNEAKEHMHQDSRLYIQVYSLTDFHHTLEEIGKNYSMAPLAKREFIEDHIIGSNVEAYEELNRQGVIDISQRDGHWYTYETAYELRLLPEV
jgi:HemK-related putative methylase